MVLQLYLANTEYSNMSYQISINVSWFWSLCYWPSLDNPAIIGRFINLSYKPTWKTCSEDANIIKQKKDLGLDGEIRYCLRCAVLDGWIHYQVFISLAVLSTISIFHVTFSNVYNFNLLLFSNLRRGIFLNGKTWQIYLIIEVSYAGVRLGSSC